MKVLVTGGAGYIGSTTATALEAAGHTPVVLDNLLTGPRAFVQDRIFYEGDVADRGLLRRIVAEHPDLDCTIHMAARIVVPESVSHPYEYYRDNVARSLELFDELVALGLPRVVFSSSASLYGLVEDFGVDETSPLEPSSPTRAPNVSWRWPWRTSPLPPPSGRSSFGTSTPSARIPRSGPVSTCATPPTSSDS